MLRIAPEIQQHILAMPETIRRLALTERTLRPIAQLVDPRDQQAVFCALLGLRIASVEKKA